MCAVDERVHYQRLDFPEELKVVVCIPDFELSTNKAREVLRQEVSLKDAVYNIQRASLWWQAFAKGTIKP